MNPIDSIYETICKKTAFQNLKDEKLVLLMQHDPIRINELCSGDAQSAAEVARISNVLLQDYHVAEKKRVLSLDIAYQKTLENLVSDYKNLANTKDSPKEKISLEQMCFSYILEEASQRFFNANRRMPDGTNFHFTELYPCKWKTQLESGFSNIDLVDSVNSLTRAYNKAYQKRERLVDLLLRYGRHVQEDTCYASLKKTKEQLPTTDPELDAYLSDVETPYKKYEAQIWNCVYNSITKGPFLDQYKEEVIAAQKNVEHIRAQIKLANIKATHEKKWGYRLLPNDMTPDFQSVILHFSMADFFEKSTLSWETPQMQTGAALLFANHIPYDIDMDLLRENATFEVGFMLKRLDISRDWFFPELFRYYPEISPKITWAYPVALVLMKDITLRIEFHEKAIEYIPIFRRHILLNRNFLCFQEDYCLHNIIYTIDHNIVICKINWPMIAGYYIKDI